MKTHWIRKTKKFKILFLIYIYRIAFKFREKNQDPKLQYTAYSKKKKSKDLN